MTTIAESSAQLVSPLRYNADMFAPDDEQAYETPPGAKYFHTESTRGTHHLMSPHGALGTALLDTDVPRQHDLGGGVSAQTPQSSVIVRGIDPLAYAANQQRQNGTVGSVQAGEEGKLVNENEPKSARRKKLLGAAVLAVIVLLVVGVGVFLYFMFRDRPTEPDTQTPSDEPPVPLMRSSSPSLPPASKTLSSGNTDQGANAVTAALSMSGNEADDWRPIGDNNLDTRYETPEPDMLRSSRGVPIDFVGNDAADADDGTTYYFPSPMPTPPHVTVDTPTMEIVRSSEQQQQQQQQRKHQPPPSSWFGASAPTRGAAAAEMVSDEALQTHEALSRIYDKKANSVLGGKNQPPYGQVSDEAARHIGWAEMGECGAPEPFQGGVDGSGGVVHAPAGNRSMNELYQANLAGRQYREGSSASTLISPGEAAQQTIGNNPDLSEKHAEGRARAKQISAEATAAIGSIYAKKRQAAAGLSAAAMAQDQASNDVNFDYFDAQTQQPFSGAP